MWKNTSSTSIIDSVEIVSGEIINVQKESSCTENNDVIDISKHSSFELNCKKDKNNKLKKKWTTTTKFNTYQECSGNKGSYHRLIKICPGNSVFWNVLQCCVDIMDFPCKSNCKQPIKKCI